MKMIFFLSLTWLQLLIFSPAHSALVIYGENLPPIHKAIKRFENETGKQVLVLDQAFEKNHKRLEINRDEHYKEAVDLFITQDLAKLHALKKEDFTQAFQNWPGFETIFDGVKDVDSHYFGLAYQANLLIYNTDLSPQAIATIETYEDLSLPQWSKELCAPLDKINAYNHSLIYFLTAAYGMEFTQEVAHGWIQNADYALTPQTNITEEEIAEAVENGSCRLGLVRHDTYLKAQEKALKEGRPFTVAHKFLNQNYGSGAHINAYGVGLLKSSGDPVSAHRFVQILLSDQSQTEISESLLSYPASLNTPFPKQLNGLSTFQPSLIEPTWIYDNSSEFNWVFQSLLQAPN